jgi:hypothetical protein
MSALSYTPPPSIADEVGLLWSFDTDSELWSTEYSAGIVTGISGGSSATNPFLNEAYYLGGLQDSWVLADAVDLYVAGMMTLNMTDSTWRNETVPGLSTFGAFMEYLPIGEKGALVVFGGRDYQEGVANPDGVANDMSEIRVYDVSSGTWVTQKATGTQNSPDIVPDARVIGCSAMTPAPDNSSYNIYMVGGEAQLGGPRINDIWVLTLPSFTWIKIADDRIGSVGSTCRPFGRQMLLVGSGPLSDTECQELFRVLDMTSLEWTNAFDPTAQPYLVPPAISSAVGGNSMGGAINLAPSNGGDSWPSSLEGLFSKTPWGPANFTSKKVDSHNGTSNPTASPTASPTADRGSKPKPDVIAGASVASFVSLILVLAVVWWFCFRQRRARPDPNNARPFLDDKAELHAQDANAATRLQRRASGTEIDGRGIAVVPGMHELALPPEGMEEMSRGAVSNRDTNMAPHRRERVPETPTVPASRGEGGSAGAGD